ncbi:hypothetical protein [Paucidesulfovibrio longus]|uniref:hypothetical protein n=1 Tax=Paucidesulfovibrio longus TaxID=889 RepID=UPI0003B5A86C|nr:hypothetical protein [Paucidesulfovibrio longus]
MSVIDTSQSSLSTGRLGQSGSGLPGIGTRQLSEDELKRLEELTNKMMDLLAETDGQPSDEQRGRIREIENEIAKITGKRPRRSLAAATAKLPLKHRDQDKEQDTLAVESPFLIQERVAGATLPKEKQIQGEGTLAGPLNNAAASYLALIESGGLPTPTGPVSGYAASGRALSSPGSEALSGGAPRLNRHV